MTIEKRVRFTLILIIAYIGCVCRADESTVSVKKNKAVAEQSSSEQEGSIPKEDDPNANELLDAINKSLKSQLEIHRKRYESLRNALIAQQKKVKSARELEYMNRALENERLNEELKAIKNAHRLLENRTKGPY